MEFDINSDSDDQNAGERGNGTRILVGIFTTSDRMERRFLIRLSYLPVKPDNVDLFFVVCGNSKWESEEDRSAMEWEQRMYGDMMILNCNENMNKGKTHTFFSHIGREMSGEEYGFAMKTDDDAYLHLPNLARRLKDSPRSGFFFGRDYHGFMAGMGYILSWDLVTWIAFNQYTRSHRVGQEDRLLADWLRFSGLVERWESEEYDFYDDPTGLSAWSHPFSNSTILIHQLKRTDRFLMVAYHFHGNYEGEN